MVSKLELQVAQLEEQHDVGRGRARISSKAMEELGVSTGNAIEIKGKRTTSAVVQPALPEGAEKNIIRIDKTTRENAGVDLNEYVTVRKTEAKDATHITLAPLNFSIVNIDEGFIEFVRTRILGTPLVKGRVIQN